MKEREAEIKTLKAKSGYSNNNFRGGVVKNEAGRSFVGMTADQKRTATCADWNGNGCSLPEISGHCGTGQTRKKHGCSKITGADRICWARDHTEPNHQ